MDSRSSKRNGVFFLFFYLCPCVRYNFFFFMVSMCKKGKSFQISHVSMGNSHQLNRPVRLLVRNRPVPPYTHHLLRVESDNNI